MFKTQDLNTETTHKRVNIITQVGREIVGLPHILRQLGPLLKGSGGEHSRTGLDQHIFRVFNPLTLRKGEMTGTVNFAKSKGTILTNADPSTTLVDTVEKGGIRQNFVGLNLVEEILTISQIIRSFIILGMAITMTRIHSTLWHTSSNKKKTPNSAWHA